MTPRTPIDRCPPILPLGGVAITGCLIKEYKLFRLVILCYHNLIFSVPLLVAFESWATDLSHQD
jgi:hypothetical protein